MVKRLTYGVIASMLMLVAVVGCAYRGAAPAPQMAEEAWEATAAPRAPEEEAAAGEGGGRAVDQASTERLIIRNASLDIVVPDTEETVDAVKALVSEMNGYVVDSNLDRYQEGLRAHLKVRVPAEDLDQALEQIRELATEVRRESISGQDVTEEYVDLQSRLRYLEATEERLLEFLEEAEDTEAALAVYEQLQDIQADIEQVKGRMQYLEQSAAMATITLDITPDELAQPIQVGGWHPEGTLRDAFESLIKVLQFLVDALIVIVVLIIPVIAVITLPLVGLFLLIRGLIRRRRSRKDEGGDAKE